MSLPGNRFPAVGSIRPSRGSNRAQSGALLNLLVTLRWILSKSAMTPSRESHEPPRNRVRHPVAPALEDLRTAAPRARRKGAPHRIVLEQCETFRAQEASLRDADG